MLYRICIISIMLIISCLANDNMDNNIKINELEKQKNIVQSIESNEKNVTNIKDYNNFQFLYGFDFDFFADNTENSYPYWQTRTLLTASLFPEIGIRFYGQNLRVGGYFIVNMGDKIPKNMGISIYYDTSYKNFKGYFGIFSKKYIIGEYPNLYYRKDFIMLNPMINGMAFQYISQKDFIAEFVFDWYGGNLQKRIDEFLAQTFIKQGFINNTLFVGSSFLLYHTKNDEILNPNSNILDIWLLDRLYYNVFAGIDFKNKFMPYIYMDKMQIILEVLGSVERKRRHSTGLDPFSNNIGMQFDIYMQYKGFGIENSLYYGDRHYKYFNEYGENLYSGLPFYQSNLYDRAELYWEYKNQYLTSRFSIILHFMQNNFAHQQMLTINIDTQKLFAKAIKSFK